MRSSSPERGAGASRHGHDAPGAAEPAEQRRLGIMDRNADGRISPGEAAFAHEMRSEYVRAVHDEEHEEPVGCGSAATSGCAGCLALVAFLVVAALVLDFIGGLLF